MPGIGVIVNPHAGGNRADETIAARLQAAVSETGFVLCPRTLQELEESVRQCREEAVDILAVCGGDGSYFRTLSALICTYGESSLPAVLPLRGGSMNTIARSLGVRRGRPENVLAQVSAEYRVQRPLRTTRCQVLRVGTDQYGFMVGCGVIVNFLQLYYSGQERGPLAAAAWLCRAILSGIVGGALAQRLLRGFQAHIRCDGEPVPHRLCNVLYASTIREIGLGFVATYLASRKLGYFHFLAGSVRAWQVIARLHRLRQGCPLQIPTLYDNLARRVFVEFECPTHYMIDGDVLGPVSSLEIQAGPVLSIVQE